jgi:hypothetical protein
VQPDADAKIEELSRQIAGLQEQHIGDQMGPLNRGTLRNLLAVARECRPGPVELATFMAMHPRAKIWKHWGIGVAAFREDFPVWLKNSWRRTARTDPWGHGLPAPATGTTTADLMAAVVEDPENPWVKTRDALSTRISPQEFGNWVERTRGGELEGGTLTVFLPDQATKDFIEQEFAVHISQLIETLNSPISTIVYRPVRANTS